MTVSERNYRPQEALAKAMLLISNLRRSLPCKVGRVLDCSDQMMDALSKEDEGQFPLNLILGEIGALRSSMTSEYDDLESEVGRESFIYELVVSLEHRIRLSMEFIVANKIFESVEARFVRIDGVLPSRNYSLRELLSQLPFDLIGVRNRQRLESALDHFDQQEYKAAVRETGEAGEAIFGLYKRCFEQVGCTEIPENEGPAVGRIRQWMADPKNLDCRASPLVSRGRIEWFLLSMFETLHYLRNAAAHPMEIGTGIPEWQARRRAAVLESPECARLGLCLVFQIALELAVILEHQETENAV